MVSTTPKGWKHSNITTFSSLAFMTILLSVIISWHEGTKGTQSPRRMSNTAETSNTLLTTGTTNRFLSDILDEDLPTINDDTTRSETCRRYLKNFLNGTTDARDECQAFYNAYREADCAHETHGSIFAFNDGNETDDSVTLDDFFQRWECCDSIKAYYNNHCEHDSGLHSLQLLGVMLVLLCCTMIKALLKTWNVHWIPDACAFILVGTFVGVMLRLLDSNLVPRLSFDNDLFLQIMLPPIIFEAALSIDKKAFRRDLFPILLFAGVGTGFSAVAIGWMVHQVSNMGTNGTNLPWLDSLVFGSLISSIDPVATLSILAGVGVSQTDTLYTLIFGESLLNDGVAIVLFEVLKDHLGEDDSIGQDAYKEMGKHFGVVLCGSIAIGVGVGMCCTLYFWALREKQTAVTEVAIFFCWSLIPYYIADGLHCSGIISIMVMGFFLDFFVIGTVPSAGHEWRQVFQHEHEHEQSIMDNLDRNYYDLSVSHLRMVWANAFSGKGHILDTSRHHVGFVAHVVSMIMETAIFAYLGLFLFNGNEWNFRLNLTAITSCVSSRLFMVIILSLLVNIAVFFDFENRISRCLKSVNPLQRINLADDDDTSSARVYLDRKTQVILLLAGVRGAVSFALVENIPVWDNVNKSGSKFKAELKTMTSSSIVFTLFIFGALTYMAVKHGSEPSESERARAVLTSRLLNDPIAATNDREGMHDEQSEQGMGRTFMEIERDAQNVGGIQNMNSNTGHQEDMNNPDARYRSSNEWIS